MQGFDGEPEGRRLLGGRGRTWEGTIEIELKEIGPEG